MTTNKVFSDWAIYIIVSPVVLFISLMVAMHISFDFHNDTLVKLVIFIGIAILLETVLAILINCPYDIMCAKQKSRAKVLSPEVSNGITSPEVIPSQSDSVQYSHEDYIKSVECHQKEVQDEKDKRLRVVLEYTHLTMSRFLYEEELNILLDEIRKWSEDINYSPTPIKHFKENVENIPLRHFIWNIAERLGRRDYNMAIRIDFIRTLFPKPFEGLDYSTLKNLKAPCANDIIPIDEPTHGEPYFHDKTADNNE